jgi:hypothetical protein
MARDVRLEMNRIVNRELAGRLVDGDAAGAVAADLVRRLRAEDPGLLVGWLQLHAAEALGAHIARRHPAPVRRGPSPEAIEASKARAESQAA